MSRPIGGESDALVTRTWLTAAEIAESIRAELNRGDTEFALRVLARGVADFRSLRTEANINTFLGEPATTGDTRWDALIAATISRECRQAGAPAPAWTHVTPLESWWFPANEVLLRARTMQHTPIDFRILGIWLDAKALETL